MKRKHTRLQLVRSFICIDLYENFVDGQLQFHYDPSFRWGDIALFVTMYDLELKILSFLQSQKNAILNVKIWYFLDTIYLILINRIGTRSVGE